MIRLRKLDASNRYYGAAIAWLALQRAEYRRRRDDGEPQGAIADKYRDDAVKIALLEETHRKCAYCESQYLPVAFGDVEHMLPRDADPERQLDYENLTLACCQCNNAKSNYEPDDDLQLLNPYKDDPGEFFLALAGEMLWPVLSPPEAIVRAMRTIDALALNRADLIVARREIVGKCFDAIREYHYAPLPQLKPYALRKINEMQGPQAPYSFVARAVFAMSFAPDTDPNPPRRGIERQTGRTRSGRLPK